MSKFHITHDDTLIRNLLNKYGGEVDDYFKLWPTGKSYFYSSDKKAAIAYSIKYSTAVCLFDPIGDNNSIKLVLSEFLIYCKENNLYPLFIQATTTYKDIYEQLGLSSLIIGSDGVINIKHFLKETVKNKYFRNIVNRFSKNGFLVEVSYPPHNKKLYDKFNDVSKDWLKLPHHKEWNFLAGRFSYDYLKDLPIYYLSENKDKIWAFANSLPEYRKGVSTIDLIRRRRDSPKNSVDFLYIGIMRLLNKNEKIKDFNIGMSPIDGKYFIETKQEKRLLTFYKSSQSIIGFKGLHQFKAKYQPKWESRYVFRQKGTLKLIRAGLAVYRLMM